ncbi:MAG: hypothetical protein GXO96_03010 [Nitrospirae bacterium]|nr:hypothetical protein [Candidatus Manganitrophaceae bacterium]
MRTKGRVLFIILGVVVVMFYGLLSFVLFANDVQTTSPTPEQVQHSQDQMYINKNIIIDPLGFKLVGSGMDDAIWFKFRTESKLRDLFNPKVVDLELLSEEYAMISDTENEWWNVAGKTLLGGQISLPDHKIMNIGIDRSQGEDISVVYIMWHGM